MTRTGFVTGLAREARLLQRHSEVQGWVSAGRVACAGADSRRARRLADSLVERGAGALVSFGLAGGLESGRRPGDLLLPQAVLVPGGPAVPTSNAWRGAIGVLAAEAGLAVNEEPIAGSDEELPDAGAKRGLFQATGAIAVDMESHAVALAAQTAGVPFLVLRAVADPAHRHLPRAVRGTIAASGRPQIGLIVARLALRPWEVPPVVGLGREAQAAFRSLRGILAVAGQALVRD